MKAPLNRRQFGRLMGGCGAALLGGAPLRAALSGKLQPAAATVADNLKMRSGRVIEILERHIETGYLTGAVALLGRGSHAEVVTVGDQSRETPGVMRRDSLFRITSMTQPITAAATLTLIDEGKLRLDEPIDHWLPELAHRRVLRSLRGPTDDTVPAKRPITVEDLLTCRCGLGILPSADEDAPIRQRIAELELPGFGPPAPAARLSPEEWLRRLGTLPLLVQPGETWLANTAFDILGVLIARVAHKPLPQLLHERLFGPLGMKDTAFIIPAAKAARFVSAYRLESGRAQLEDAAAASLWMSAPAFPDGAAGLLSTADDYFAFSYFLLSQGHRGGVRLLSRAQISAMTSDHLTASQSAAAAPILGEHCGWGFGIAVVTATTAQGVPAGAYGWHGGFGTSWVADRASETSAILLTQTLFASPEPPAVHQEFWSAVFAPPLL
jgi:CubicO group peptidase (beta-lactamase class C family)